MKTAAFIIQILCLILVTCGIAIEITYEADVGFILVTLGSILFAISTKIKKIELHKELDNYKYLKHKHYEN